MRRTRKLWKKLLGAFIGLEVFINIFGCANTLLLHPSTNPLDAHGAIARMIPVKNGAIQVWTIRTPVCEGTEPRASLLEFCGNGTRAEEVAAWIANERWKNWPVEVWVMNYPGYGGSSGSATLTAIPPAALATYDALHASAPDRPIFLEANSLGGVSATYVATQRPTPGVIMTNPPPLRRLIIGQYGWWNLWLLAAPVAWQVPHDMNFPDIGPHATAPACFLLSDEDEVVRPFYHDVAVNAYAGPKHVIHIPGAGHNSPVTAESEAELGRWIQRRWNATFPTTHPVN